MEWVGNIQFLQEQKTDKNRPQRTQKTEVLAASVLCMDLITAINIENKFFDRLPELRYRVVSKWFYIIFSKIYSMKFKVGVILLAFMPSIFYRLFTATRFKGN